MGLLKYKHYNRLLFPLPPLPPSSLPCFPPWICFRSCLSLTEDTEMFATTWSWFCWPPVTLETLPETRFKLGGTEKWKQTAAWLEAAAGTRLKETQVIYLHLILHPMKLAMPLGTNTGLCAGSAPLVLVWKKQKNILYCSQHRRKARNITDCFQVFSVLFASLENFCTRFQTLCSS